ncbi:MAG: AAA family ATPase [Magnetococcales bacterium]|nr:AAA family ATPase [Magnetococcales bacterium]
MIHEIRIANYRSIRDELHLDFRVPADAPELLRFRPSPADPNVKLPSVIGFFGANASGKTNILRALTDALNFIKYSVTSHNNNEIRFFNPFFSPEGLNHPTLISAQFDAPFGTDGKSSLMEYSLEFDNQGKTFPTQVLSESLFHITEGERKTIIDRRVGSPTFTSSEFSLRQDSEILAAARPECSVISTLAHWNNTFAKQLLQWIGGLQTNQVGHHRNGVPASMAEEWIRYYVDNPEQLERLNHELQTIDVGISHLEFIQSPQKIFPVFTHKGLNRPLLFEDESSGTRQFTHLFPQLDYVLSCGSVAVIDELDSDLHPELTQEIIRWFQSDERNPHGAQLLFTSNNPVHLNELELEKVFFVEKDQTGNTTAFGAKDIEGLSREDNLFRHYLSGALGALPRIG